MLEARASGGAVAHDDEASYEEISILEEIYATTPYPSRIVLEQIANEFQTSIHKVRCWFNNRRAKTARDNLAKASKRANGKHSLKKPPTAQQRGPLNLQCFKARPVQTPKVSTNYAALALGAGDRRLSLPAKMGGTTAIAGHALQPQRYQAHDDLAQVKSKSSAQTSNPDGLDPLLQAISNEANALLTRTKDTPDSNFGTSKCLALLKALLVKAEKFVELGLVKGVCVLITLARSFAYGIANLDNSYQERTQFSALLSDRLLNAILRTDLAALPASRRSTLQQTVTFFCKRVSQYDSIRVLQALPALFLNPWSSKLVTEIMQGIRKFEELGQPERELPEVARARLDILIENSRFSEAVNLAKWYFECGLRMVGPSDPNFLIVYVHSLLKARLFDDAVNALIQNRDSWKGERISEWVQHLVDAGSPRHAEMLLQTLSSSLRKLKR